MTHNYNAKATLFFQGVYFTCESTTTLQTWPCDSSQIVHNHTYYTLLLYFFYFKQGRWDEYVRFSREKELPLVLQEKESKVVTDTPEKVLLVAEYGQTLLIQFSKMSDSPQSKHFLSGGETEKRFHYSQTSNFL